MASRIFVYFTPFLKNLISLQSIDKKKGLESGLLYVEIIAQALGLLLPTTDLEFRVFRDHRHLRKLPQTRFNEILKSALLPNLPAKAIIQIEALDSLTNSNIQIADWICGSLFRYYNKGKNGKRFFLLLKNNIVKSGYRELFKDYWQEKYTKQKTTS